ncbi:MAG: cell wall hydrolase [Lachnospiraceae bacterium]|nr:cell wall hydrolase [Lachnospiraceae bacterium]
MKYFKKMIPFFVSVCMLAVSMPMSVYATGTTLDEINEAEREIQQTEDEKEAAESEKGSKKNELNKLQFQRGTLRAQLDAFNDDLSSENDKYNSICAEISDKKNEIEIKKLELAAAKADEEEQYEAMKKRLQNIYEQPDNMYLEMMLSSSSFSTFLNIADYIFTISQYDSGMLKDYRNTTLEVSDKEAALENELADLEELERQSKEEQARITELINTTNDYVKEYSIQINDASDELAQIEKEIEEKEALLREQEANLEYLRAKYEEEKRLSEEASNSDRRDISEVSFSENDRYLLANLIYCEAGGEPYEGQLGVGAVVINRLLSCRYPDTVYDVIYQKSQFSPAGSGRLALALAKNSATPSCYRAADEAMSGVTNVGNCMYFRTPIPGLEGIRIGNHIFY